MKTFTIPTLMSSVVLWISTIAIFFILSGLVDIPIDHSIIPIKDTKLMTVIMYIYFMVYYALRVASHSITQKQEYTIKMSFYLSLIWCIPSIFFFYIFLFSLSYICGYSGLYIDANIITYTITVTYICLIILLEILYTNKEQKYTKEKTNIAEIIPLENPTIQTPSKSLYEISQIKDDAKKYEEYIYNYVDFIYKEVYVTNYTRKILQGLGWEKPPKLVYHTTRLCEAANRDYVINGQFVAPNSGVIEYVGATEGLTLCKVCSGEIDLALIKAEHDYIKLNTLPPPQPPPPPRGILCSRCGGSGYIGCYSHIQNGVCFKCGGRGRLHT
jgi:hypothetical protein